VLGDVCDMKVLHLSTYGVNSGAGIAALRLLQAEQCYGMDATMLMMSRDTGGYAGVYSLGLERGLYRQWRGALWGERGVLALLNGFNREQTFKSSVGLFGVSMHSVRPYLGNSDLLHLHWTQHAFLSLRTLEQIFALGKPIVITMHDSWWSQGIQQIATTDRFTAPLRWLDKQIRGRKECLMARYPVHWVTVSHALREEVSRSEIVPREGISVIGNVLDNAYYQQILPQGEIEGVGAPEYYQILFVATRLDDPVKGWGYLQTALQLFVEQIGRQAERVRLLLVGEMSDLSKLRQIPLSIQYMGRISDVDRLQQLYRKSSVLISTSERESFGQTLLEALSCGTPIVVRNSGGPEDIVINGLNGSIVAHDNPLEMATALQRHFSGAVHYDQAECRASAERFAPQVIVGKYAQLYKQMCCKGK